MIRLNKTFSILALSLLLSLASCDPSGGATSNNNQNVTYSVNLRGNGGTPINQTVYVRYGNSMPSASRPSRFGYVFLGYYDSMYASSGTMYYTSSMQSANAWDRTTDGTLWAVWRLN
jgi:hypothetical protein